MLFVGDPEVIGVTIMNTVPFPIASLYNFQPLPFVVIFCLLGIFKIQELQVKSLPGIDHVLKEKLNRRQITTCGKLRMISKMVPMATDSVDVLERIASQLFTTSHEQQFNEEEIQVVSYPDKLFADMKSEPLSDASVPNMDVVINSPISGGISLMPSSLSQVNTSVFQQLPEEFLAKLKYELLCNSKIAIIQLDFCILTLTELQCRLLDTPNEQLWPGVSKLVNWHEYP
ncbi:hypothetical protein P3S67_009635 [Capsicum chacoense]